MGNHVQEQADTKVAKDVMTGVFLGVIFGNIAYWNQISFIVLLGVLLITLMVSLVRVILMTIGRSSEIKAQYIATTLVTGCTGTTTALITLSLLSN
jgi:hypothetical protein